MDTAEAGPCRVRGRLLMSAIPRPRYDHAARQRFASATAAQTSCPRSASSRISPSRSPAASSAIRRASGSYRVICIGNSRLPGSGGRVAHHAHRPHPPRHGERAGQALQDVPGRSGRARLMSSATRQGAHPFVPQSIIISIILPELCLLAWQALGSTEVAIVRWPGRDARAGQHARAGTLVDSLCEAGGHEQAARAWRAADHVRPSASASC